MRTLGSFGACKLAAVALSLLALTLFAPVRASTAPDVPDILKVPEGNKVHGFVAHAVGVQIYRWSGGSWLFQRPEAMLFDSDGKLVGSHFAGPTWESNSGSRVVGVVWHRYLVPNAIPWLLLNATATEGPGILAGTTFIQRVNTVGGQAPSSPGTEGQVVHVDYMADYYFYRAQS